MLIKLKLSVSKPPVKTENPLNPVELTVPVRSLVIIQIFGLSPPRRVFERFELASIWPMFAISRILFELIVNISSCSKTAAEKIKKAGGEVIIKS